MVRPPLGSSAGAEHRGRHGTTAHRKAEDTRVCNKATTYERKVEQIGEHSTTAAGVRRHGALASLHPRTVL